MQTPTKSEAQVIHVALAVRGVRNRCRKESFTLFDICDLAPELVDDACKANLREKAHEALGKHFKSVRIANLRFETSTLSRYPQPDGTVLESRVSPLFGDGITVETIVGGEAT